MSAGTGGVKYAPVRRTAGRPRPVRIKFRLYLGISFFIGGIILYISSNLFKI